MTEREGDRERERKRGREGGRERGSRKQRDSKRVSVGERPKVRDKLCLILQYFW